MTVKFPGLVLSVATILFAGGCVHRTVIVHENEGPREYVNARCHHWGVVVHVR